MTEQAYAVYIYHPMGAGWGGYDSYEELIACAIGAEEDLKLHYKQKDTEVILKPIPLDRVTPDMMASKKADIAELAKLQTELADSMFKRDDLERRIQTLQNKMEAGK